MSFPIIMGWRWNGVLVKVGKGLDGGFSIGVHEACHQKGRYSVNERARQRDEVHGRTSHGWNVGFVCQRFGVPCIGGIKKWVYRLGQWLNVMGDFFQFMYGSFPVSSIAGDERTKRWVSTVSALFVQKCVAV